MRQIKKIKLMLPSANFELVDLPGLALGVCMSRLHTLLDASDRSVIGSNLNQSPFTNGSFMSGQRQRSKTMELDIISAAFIQ